MFVKFFSQNPLTCDGCECQVDKGRFDAFGLLGKGADTFGIMQDQKRSLYSREGVCTHPTESQSDQCKSHCKTQCNRTDKDTCADKNPSFDIAKKMFLPTFATTVVEWVFRMMKSLQKDPTPDATSEQSRMSQLAKQALDSMMSLLKHVTQSVADFVGDFVAEMEKAIHLNRLVTLLWVALDALAWCFGRDRLVAWVQWVPLFGLVTLLR